MTTPINNLYGRDGFFWWIGVVEDREDPLFLGRCRVRIFGYHIDNKDLMPTRDLPWAVPLQSVTSAAMSGIGSTAMGPLPGTWVMGFFADGKDCQQPMIIGTFAGFKLPTDACVSNQQQEELFAPDTRRDANGNPLTDSEGRPIKVTQSSSNNITAAPLNNTGPVITVAGDSIAVGTGAALQNKQAGVTVVATVGISTKKILADVTAATAAHNPRFAVLSGGGNDLAEFRDGSVPPPSSRIESVKSNARQIRAVVKAGAYVWLLSRNRAAADAIRAVANEYGDRVIDTINYSSKDGIHPADYNAVARDVLRLLEGVNRGVDTPADRSSNNLNTNVIPSPFILRDLPPLSKSDIQVLWNSIGYVESSSIPGGKQNYAAENNIFFIGKYQFGSEALTTLGYVKWAADPKTGKGTTYSNETVAKLNSVWTGKNGITGAAAWKANGPVQEQVMFAFMESNYKALVRSGVITPTMDRRQAAGLLHSAHLSGAGGTSAWIHSRKQRRPDAYGATQEMVYAISYNALEQGGRKLYSKDDYLKGRLNFVTPEGRNVLQRDSNNGRQPPPNADPSGPLNDPRIGNELGFNDPDSVYPTCDYAFHPDTNKLATGQDLATTVVKYKVDRAVTEVEVADTGIFGSGLAGAQLADILMPGGWNEQVFYNARYPYNKVMETESGHVVEYDDTPENERIHVFHRSGTYHEIGPDGTKQSRVEGDEQKIVIRNSRVYIQGNWDVTVEGAHNLLVKSALNVEVRGDATFNVSGSANYNVAGDYNVNVSGDYKVRAKNLIHEAVPTLSVDVPVNPDQVATDLTGTPPITLKPGNITFFAAGDYRLTGLGSYDLFVPGNIVNYAAGQIAQSAILGINMWSPNQIAADAGFVYWQMGIGLSNTASLPPATAPLTGLRPSLPTLEQVVAAGIDYVADFIGNKADVGGAHGDADSVLGDSSDIQNAARNTRGGKLGTDVIAEDDLRKGGFTTFDPAKPFANPTPYRNIDASDLTNAKNISETAKVSKKWNIGKFLTKGQLSFLTTTVVVGLAPAGDRNLSVGEKLGLGALLAGSKAILSTAGLSNTQKIIGTLGANLAVTRLRGEKGYPLGLGFTVLARSLPAIVDVGLDSYSKGNPNLTADQRRNLGWIGVGAAAVSAAASNPNVNSKNFAQQVGLNVLGAGYTYSVRNGILTTGTQRYLGQIGVTLASNALRGDDEANKRILRNLAGAALGSVVDQTIQRALNAANGTEGRLTSGNAVIGRVLGQIVRNEITGQRDNNRRIVGYAAGSYISDLVYKDIVDSYGGESAGLAAQTAGLLGGFSRNLITQGSLTSDANRGGYGRRVTYQGGQSYSTGPNGGKLTGAQVATNIKALAVNTLDPIADRYPDVKILVGYLDGAEGQHGTGQAVDIHFPQRRNSEYYEIARWIKDNLAYDQLLLETEILQGVQRFWIHISFNLDGNRPPEGVFAKGTLGPKVGTVVGGKLYRPFLVQLARGST